MTSEVVVMNRTGIALASDSAATVRARGKAKLFHADKLFMLSNSQPVGLMVYGNSALLGVPWEVILKLFRSDLDSKKFKSIEEYAHQLISFLSENEHLFPVEEQKRYYLHLVDSFFTRMAEKIKSNYFTLLLDQDDDTKKPEIKEVQAALVAATVEDWRKKEDSKCFNVAIGTELATFASAHLSKLVNKHFPEAGDKVVINLYELAKLIVSKDEIPQDSRSGIVIAGYGNDDYFPVMQEYQVGGIYKNQLKFRLIDTQRITNETQSVVKPFAQSEMAQTFLHGLSPAVERKQIAEIIKAVVEAPDAIIDGIPGVGKERKAAYKAKVREASTEAARAIVKKLKDYRHALHHTPMLQFIAHLPKNELAHVASSLVNLNSFQKRMTFGEDETVGGPIDVAVISKGDGFVWIARKHYFTAELNAHFFRNRSNLAVDRSLMEKEDDNNEAQG